MLAFSLNTEPRWMKRPQNIPSLEECNVDDGRIVVDKLKDIEFEGKTVLIIWLCPVTLPVCQLTRHKCIYLKHFWWLVHKWSSNRIAIPILSQQNGDDSYPVKQNSRNLNKIEIPIILFKPPLSCLNRIGIPGILFKQDSEIDFWKKKWDSR